MNLCYFILHCSPFISLFYFLIHYLLIYFSVLFYLFIFILIYIYFVLLADRTNGRAYATLLRPSVVVCRL